MPEPPPQISEPPWRLYRSSTGWLGLPSGLFVVVISRSHVPSRICAIESNYGSFPTPRPRATRALPSLPLWLTKEVHSDHRSRLGRGHESQFPKQVPTLSILPANPTRDASSGSSAFATATPQYSRGPRLGTFHRASRRPAGGAARLGSARLAFLGRSNAELQRR